MSNRWISRLMPALLVVAAGCATPTPPVAIAAKPASIANPAADSDIQCHNEKLTGSRLSTRVCLNKAQREAREAAAQAQRDKMSLPSAISCGQANQMGCPH